MWVPALIALTVGLGLVLTWAASRVASTGWLAVGWLCYGAYEASMASRLLCSGECNIRVDLLLIYPVMLIWTASVAIRAVRRRWRERPT